MSTKHSPAGWDEGGTQRVLDHYEAQSAEEAVAEDEAAFESTTHTAIELQVDLVPGIRAPVARRGKPIDPSGAHGAIRSKLR